jgi:ribosomal protein S24E
MKKLQETPSPLLNRTEVIFEIDHFQKPTPKKEEIKKSLAQELKVDEEVINLNKVITHFGSSKIKVIADIYKTKEDLQKLVKVKKTKAKDGEAPAEAKEEEKPDEAPKKEVKQETKSEEKKE